MRESVRGGGGRVRGWEKAQRVTCSTRFNGQVPWVGTWKYTPYGVTIVSTTKPREEEVAGVRVLHSSHCMMKLLVVLSPQLSPSMDVEERPLQYGTPSEPDQQVVNDVRVCSKPTV